MPASLSWSITSYISSQVVGVSVTPASSSISVLYQNPTTPIENGRA